MRCLFLGFVLVSAGVVLPAEAPFMSGVIEEHCTVEYSRDSCIGAGCASVAVITYSGRGEDRVEFVYFPFPSTIAHAAPRQAALAKALLKRAQEGWELDQVTSGADADQMTYRLKRSIAFLTKG